PPATAAEPIDEPLCGPLHIGGVTQGVSDFSGTLYGSMASGGFSEDNRALLLADYSGRVQVWDPATGEPLTPLIRDGAWVIDLALDSRGRLVSVTNAMGVRVWDLGLAGRGAAEDLLPLVQLQSGNELSRERGRFVPFQTAALKEGWQRVRAGTGPLVAPARADAWHRQQAAECADAEDGGAWRCHFDRLLEEKGAASAELWARRGDADLRLSDFPAARQDYAKAAAAENGPPDGRLAWDIVSARLL